MNDELEKLLAEHAANMARVQTARDEGYRIPTEDEWKMRDTQDTLRSAAVNALPDLLAKVRQYENLIRAMLENEPDDIVADGGHTVLDEWRYNARALLETKP